MQASTAEQPAPCIAGGRVRSATAVIPQDGLAALDELMTVVEALCPVWPPRPIGDGRGPYRL